MFGAILFTLAFRVTFSVWRLEPFQVFKAIFWCSKPLFEVRRSDPLSQFGIQSHFRHSESPFFSWMIRAIFSVSRLKLLSQFGVQSYFKCWEPFFEFSVQSCYFLHGFQSRYFCFAFRFVIFSSTFKVTWLVWHLSHFRCSDFLFQLAFKSIIFSLVFRAISDIRSRFFNLVFINVIFNLALRATFLVWRSDPLSQFGIQSHFLSLVFKVVIFNLAFRATF